MNYSKFKTLAAYSVLMVASMASHAEVFTLKQTYELALKNDPQWASTKNQNLANQQTIDQGRSALLPQIGLTGSIAETDVDYEGSTADDSFESHGYSASIRQPLFRLNSWHTYKSSKALNSQYEADFQRALEAFYLRVVTLYLDVLRANADVTYRKAEQEAIARQLEQSKQRFDVGLVAITDVHEAQAAYDTAVSARITAESNQFVALRSLETIVGTPVDNVVSLDEALPVIPPEPADLSLWINQALENNASLQSAIFATEAAQQDYKSKRGSHAPTLDIVGSHNYNSSDAMNNGFRSPDATSNQIALELNVPLYTGGATSANRRQSKYQFLATKDNEQLVRRQVTQTTTSYYQLMLASVAQVKASKQSALSAKVALEATQAGYEAGTRTIVDVLNVQRTLFQNERDYTNAIFNYVIYSLNLKQVSGTLTEEDILVLEQWMQTNS